MGDADPALANLVELWQSSASTGLGWLVAHRLVLTHASTVRPHETVQVRVPATGGRHTAAVLWADELTALVEIRDENWSLAVSRPTRWGVSIGADSWLEARVVADRPVAIEISNLAMPAPGRWEPRLALSHQVDRRTTDWPGPGSPVLCGQLVVGVLGPAPVDAGARPRVSSLAASAEDPAFRSTVERRTGRPLCLEPVELGRAIRPWYPSEGPALPAALLRPEHEAVPFNRRDPITHRLAAWCISGRPLSGLILTGPRGQGKRRLARRLADELRLRGWAVGELVDRPAGSWVDAVARSRRPVLLIVDEAPVRGEELIALAEQLGSRGGRAAVRILLLAPDAGPWWSRLTESSPRLRDVFDQPPEPLPELAPTPLEQEHVLTESVEAFYRHPLIADRVARPRDESRPAGAIKRRSGRPGQALNLQVAALASVLVPDGRDGRPAEEILLDLEREGWERAAANLSAAARSAWRPALTAALLFGASSEPVALQTLQAVPGLNAPSLAPVRRELAEWIRALYPPQDPFGRYWDGLYPIELLVRHLDEEYARPGLIEATLPSVEATQAYRALALLVTLPSVRRAGDGADPAPGFDRLAALVTGHLRLLGPELTAVAADNETAEELLRAILDPADLALTEELVRELLARIKDPAGPLSTVRRRLGDWLIDTYRAAAEGGSSAGQAQLASELTSAAAQAAAEGDQARAGVLCDDALSQYRSLESGGRSIAFATPLAECLRLRATLFAAEQRFPQAVRSAEEAAARYGALATTADPDLRPRYADTLELVARYTLVLDARPEATRSLRAAAGVRRELVAEAPAGGPADTLVAAVGTLSQLGSLLWTEGDRPAALAAALEAVEYARRLHHGKARQYRLPLLTTLQTLCGYQFELGETGSALDVLREAVALWRQEAEDHPDSAGEQLAAATQQLSDRLAQAGEHREALAAARDAVDHLRLTAHGQSAPGTALLASAEATLGLRLAESGRWEESAERLGQAAQGYRSLVESGQGQHSLALASTWTNLAAAMANDRPAEAADAAQQAVQLLHRMAGVRAAPWVLAAALTNFAAASLALGRSDDSLRAIQDAIALYQEHPGSGEELLRSFGVFRDGLVAIGRWGEAVELAREVARGYAEFARDDVSSYGLHHAAALHELARCLTATGRWTDGVAAAAQAAVEFARYASDSPGHQVEQADIAILLCTCLRALGRTADAVEAAQAAVSAYRRAAGTGRDADAPGLADALDLVADLAVTSDPENAGPDAEEAVAIRVRLARGGDAVHIRRLAIALRRLARSRAASGDQGAGRDAARRALDESRRLRDLGVDDAAAEIAESLRELSWQLSVSGQERESLAAAVDAAAEAAAGYRALAQVRPDRYLAPLTAAWLDLSHRQTAAGDQMAALLSAREAVAAISRVRNPGSSDQQLLADGYTQLDLCLATVGEEAERFDIAQSLVTVYRALAATDPRRINDLARSLRQLSEVRAGWRTAGARRAAAAEAVALHRRLASEDPARFAAELAMSLRAQAAVLSRLRNRSEQARLSREAASLAADRRTNAA